MIRGYPRRPSIDPGETLVLHVSTDAPTFRVEFYRQGVTLEEVQLPATGALRGFSVPDGPPDEDWGWPAYEFSVPDDWRSGAYVAMLVEIDADGAERAPDRSTADGREAKALFVVRCADPGHDTSVLYKLSWTTYHAYNGTGYGSLYADAVWSGEQPQPGFKVTTRRPGGGTGGDTEPGDPVDAHHRDTPRQTFAHWDAPFIAWLEGNGHILDFCTDYDLHVDDDLLAPYNLLLSVGHDEYWSQAMRSNVERHVSRGGNVAYFGGNIAWWRIHFTDDDTAIVCAKVPPTAKDEDTWPSDRWQLVDPENRFTGVSTHRGGGWWNGSRPPLGYTVQHAEHWAYAGTGLSNGDVFGANPAAPLIGYECDGAEFEVRYGTPVATGRDGTPSGFAILGLAGLEPPWSTELPNGAATLGVYSTGRGGTVFQGATTDWPIAAAHDAVVGRITENVIERLRLASVRILGPLPGRGGRMLAAAGETVGFHADLADLSRRDELTLEWEVGCGELRDTDGPLARVRLADRIGYDTVSVLVLENGNPVAFGTRTFFPLTPIESLQVEVLTTLREIVMPGEPSSPWVTPTRDPLAHVSDVIPVRLPRLREKAADLARIADQLIERLGPDGTTTPTWTPEKETKA